MKYMGSKNRIAKYILPIILNDRKEGQCYVEPFAGGFNSIQYVDGNRIAGELNYYIASMWKELISGWVPERITKEQYKNIKENKDNYPACVVGWAGISCSYSGKWFGGFAGKVNTKGGVRDYQEESFSNVDSQIPKLKGVEVFCSDYALLEIPQASIIYCDPPYQGTTKYNSDFHSSTFFDWCRDKVSEGHRVFISEYNAPDDFICVWSKAVNSSLSANGKCGSNKNSIEKLFVHESQFKLDK